MTCRRISTRRLLWAARLCCRSSLFHKDSFPGSPIRMETRSGCGRRQTSGEWLGHSASRTGSIAGCAPLNPDRTEIMILTHKPLPPLSDFVDVLWLCEDYAVSHEKERLLPEGTVD